MEHPSGWLIEQRIADARQRADEGRLARVARRSQEGQGLFRRVHGRR